MRKVLYGLFFLAISLYAEIPKTLTTQGYLSDNSGRLSGTHTVKFHLFDVNESGTPLFTEEQNITFHRGAYSSTIGLDSSNPIDLAFDKQYWLGIEVSDENLSPRMMLGAVPYALNADIVRDSLEANISEIQTLISSIDVSSIDTKIDGNISDIATEIDSNYSNLASSIDTIRSEVNSNIDANISNLSFGNMSTLTYDLDNDGKVDKTAVDIDGILNRESVAMTGDNALAFGYETNASGSYSTALGHMTNASGDASISFGNGTSAEGNMAIAAGKETIASGTRSFAFGRESVASGTHSMAFGEETEASDSAAVAFGVGTVASGEKSIAAGKDTEASGDNSTALGKETNASGHASFTWGRETNASGLYSTAFGHRTSASEDGATAWGGYYKSLVGTTNIEIRGGSASGVSSTAFGKETNASGDYSTAWGEGTVADQDKMTAIGTYNTVENTDALFVIGNGTSDSDRNNSFVVTDQNTSVYGKLFLNGEEITAGGGSSSDERNITDILNSTDGTVATGDNALAFGYETNASGSYSTALGHMTNASGDASISFGNGTSAEGNMAIAAGKETIASGTRSFAFGRESVASGTHSMAFGEETVASDSAAVAFGVGTVASGEKSIAAGKDTEASGDNSTALGKETNASGHASFTWGRETNASGRYSTAFGNGTSASEDGATAWGGYFTNNSGEGYINIRGGSASGHSSTAFGKETIASGNSATAWGEGTVADQDKMTAIGTYNTVENTDALFVVGNGTSADARSDAFEVFSDGNVYIGGSTQLSSDRRLKTDIQSIDNAVEKVQKINGVTYSWKDENRDQSRQMGVIAQDVQKVAPELVKEGNDGYLSVSYTSMNGLLVEAIKEQQKEIEAKDKRIKELEENQAKILKALQTLGIDLE